MSTKDQTPVTTSLIPKMKFNQLQPVKKGTINPSTGNPWTDKSKPRLGVEDDREIVWAPANFVLSDHSILMGFCKANNLQMDELLAAVAMEWFETNRAELTKQADGWITAAHTAETMQQSIENLERQLKRKLELLQQLKSAETEGGEQK